MPGAWQEAYVDMTVIYQGVILLLGCTLPRHYHRAVLFAVLAGALEFAKPRLSTAWKYAKVEMRPPGPSEWGQAANEAGQFVKSITTGKFLQQTTTVSLPQELFNITRFNWDLGGLLLFNVTRFNCCVYCYSKPLPPIPLNLCHVGIGMQSIAFNLLLI